TYYEISVDDILEYPSSLIRTSADLIDNTIKQGKDIHYVKEKNYLIPVAKTDYAKDNTFGFKASDLKGYVEEKTNGRIKKEEVKSISIEDIRIRGKQFVTQKLLENNRGQTIIVNAQSANDLVVFTKALLRAETKSNFLFRTAASIIPILHGLPEKELLDNKIISSNSNMGGIIFVGSYVPTTTSQLNYLIENSNITYYEISVDDILEYPSRLIRTSVDLINSTIKQGKDLIVYTSRNVKTGRDENSSLQIVNSISAALVEIVKQLKATPKFFIAKGGITSSDIATKAFELKEANVLGQILPGIPVWQFKKSLKNKDQIYIIFPGNVGTEKSLYDLYMKLRKYT
ncbi:MAG: nucleotide-binding domain containing protein, partial [Melioribacteraceae bacterium]|nr:nucleotide-binding domain containing protein [Melioribacteraceae bacterium]